MSAYVAYDTTTPITETGVNTVGLVWKANNDYQTIINGKFSQRGVATRRTMTGDVAAFDSATTLIKPLSGDSSGPINSRVIWWAMWNRSLAEAETMSMYRDPYQLLRPVG